MDTIYFLARYTPFWSIPILLISAEFSYLFWIRKKKKAVSVCISLVLITALCTAAYFYVGGPEKSVKALIRAHWYFTR